MYKRAPQLLLAGQGVSQKSLTSFVPPPYISCLALVVHLDEKSNICPLREIAVALTGNKVAETLTVYLLQRISA